MVSKKIAVAVNFVFKSPNAGNAKKEKKPHNCNKHICFKSIVTTQEINVLYEVQEMNFLVGLHIHLSSIYSISNMLVSKILIQ